MVCAQHSHKRVLFFRFRTHAHVSTIVAKSREDKFVLSHYNFFTGQVDIGHVWTPSRPIKDTKQVFTNQENFQVCRGTV